MFNKLFIISILFNYYCPLFAVPVVTLKSGQEEIFHFYYHDSLGYGHPVIVRKGDTKIAINGPVLLFEADRNQIPYLIYPGEFINIKKDGNRYSVFTINDNYQRNSELLFFQLLVKQTGGMYMTWPVHKYQGKAATYNQVYEFEKGIANIKNQRLFILDSFSNKSLLSENFKKTATNIILCTAIKDSILLYRNNKVLLQNMQVFNKKLQQLIETTNKIKYSPLMPYLYTCLLPVSISISDNNSTEFIINTNIQFLKAYNFIEKHFRESAKIFLIARTMFAAIDNNLSITNTYLERFKNECTDPVYKKLISDKFLEKSITRTGSKKNRILLMNATTSDLNSIIERNKGKLIYLDFWASWCAPCRSEMSYSKKLKGLFESKDIAFVYISIDKSIADWKKASLEETLIDNNYLLLNSGQTPFTTQHKINSIPRYILIGKKGEVISENAKRPSDENIAKWINTYL